MTIRIHNLERWTQLPPGQSIVILGDEEERQRRVDFNVETETSVTIAIAGVETFLGAFKGMETLEFTCVAGAKLTATSEGEVWYFKNEGALAVVEDETSISFTDTMPDRQELSPELKRVMDLAMTGVNARISYIQRENEALREMLANRTQVDETTGEVADDSAGGSGGIAPAPADGTADEVPEPAGGTDGGTKPGK